MLKTELENATSGLENRVKALEQEVADIKKGIAEISVKKSVQAISCSNLSSISQDIAIGVILAKILLHDEAQQKRLISQK